MSFIHLYQIITFIKTRWISFFIWRSSDKIELTKSDTSKQVLHIPPPMSKKLQFVYETLPGSASWPICVQRTGSLKHSAVWPDRNRDLYFSHSLLKSTKATACHSDIVQKLEETIFNDYRRMPFIWENFICFGTKLWFRRFSDRVRHDHAEMIILLLWHVFPSLFGEEVRFASLESYRNWIRL